MRCLVVANKELVSSVRSALPSAEVYHETAQYFLMEKSPTSNMSCVIIQHEPELLQQFIQLSNIRARLINTPFVILMGSPDFECSRIWGRIGADKIISTTSIDSLSVNVPQLVDQYTVKVAFDEDFNINYNTMHGVMSHIMRFMESSYRMLTGVQEILDHFDITEITLLKEFQRHNLSTPKKLLMCCKVLHSVKLMKQGTKGLKSISDSCGFSNEKRFIECFHRVLQCTPSAFRARLLVDEAAWRSRMISIIKL